MHQGLDAKRLREVSSISQEYMGKKLGFSQRAISLLEEKHILEDHITNMKTEVPADNTVHLKTEYNDNITFNPLDKLT